MCPETECVYHATLYEGGTSSWSEERRGEERRKGIHTDPDLVQRAVSHQRAHRSLGAQCPPDANWGRWLLYSTMLQHADYYYWCCCCSIASWSDSDFTSNCAALKLGRRRSNYSAREISDDPMVSRHRARSTFFLYRYRRFGHRSNAFSNVHR
ncbi:hypothetical protein Trydic_g20105 [Trypoxylus dichotomus]